MRQTRSQVAVILLAILAVPPVFTAARQHGRLFPPHELNVFEGPDRDAWQRPDQVMDALRISDGSVVADLGAGGGWFTIRLAKRVGPNGKVYAEDIQPQMIEAIKRRVERENLRNVERILGKPSDPGLPKGVLDAALLVETYSEVADPVVVLRKVVAALKPDGLVGIVEHKKDGFGPGPPMDKRVDPERVIDIAQSAGLRLISHETFLRYQYMLVFGKQRAQ